MPIRQSARILCWLLAALLIACKEAPRYTQLPNDATVLAFGDSVTHGTGANTGEDYPGLLAQRSGWTVLNAGIPGDTAQAASLRIGALMQDTKPAMVIIELGGNDFLRRRPTRQVKEDLRSIIHTIKEAGALPVLVAVPELSLLGAGLGALSDAPLYTALAEEEQLLLIDDIFSQVLSNDDLRADRIHPNAAGYRAFTEGVAKVLTEAGLLKTH